MPEPCHPPCPRPWAGKTDRGLLAKDWKRWKPRPHLRAGKIRQRGLRGSPCGLAAHVTDLPTPSFIPSQEFRVEILDSTKGECETLIQKRTISARLLLVSRHWFKQ